MNAEILEQALRQVLAEADGLHARFVSTAAGPMHTRGSLSPGWRLPTLDFSDRDDPLDAAIRWMLSDVGRPSGFGGELFHHALLTLAPDRSIFYHRYHHIVSDGFTSMLLGARAAALYSQRRGGEARIRRGSRPFGRFAGVLAADQAYDESQARQEDRRFWRRAMAGWAQPARLAGRSAPATEQSLAQRLKLDRSEAARLKSAAAAHGVSFADFIIALVAIWTNALSGVDDLALGFALIARPAGRERAPVPTVATNILPVRLALRAGATAIDLARAAAAFRREARPHTRYRGERLIRELTRGEAGSFGPVVNIMAFNYHPRFGDYGGAAHNVSIGPVEDICLTVYDRRDAGDITMTLNANPALYAPDRLEILAGRFERLIEIAAGDPLLPIARIDLLGPAERNLLLRTRNQTARAIPFISLPALVRARAAETPDAPCLREGDATRGYGDVDADADRFAGRLAAGGVGRGDIVGIALPRGADTLTLILATLKAGAAFLLIDPALPAARIAAMVEDAKPALLVTRAPFAGLIPPDVRVMDLDHPAQDRASGDWVDGIGADDPAYVIFTSGTTGRPKAIAVSHRGLGSLAASLTETMGTTRSSRVLQFSSLGFDALVLELCMAFAAGACLILPREEERHGPPLGRFLDRHGITHALLPPTALAGLRAETQAAPRALIVGGEACSGALAAAWSSNRLMVNAYGPAECTVVATMSGKLSGGEPPPIGRPILNTRVYVLDAFGRLAPDGVAGELHVAGDGLALGYLGRPDLTAERFVACPFEADGARMYRTGDLVRWRPDAALEFLGRVDRQIKLRGFRIEPAEIEAALRRLAGVAEAHVMPCGADSQRVLAGYVAPLPGALLDADNVRRALGESLPEHMIPASITILPALPVTPNGKIDAAALPPPAFARSGQARPETPRERAIAPLFAAVLDRESVGVEDNFFALGGDSLKATLLIARIGEALGRELTIATLFNAPTVRSLARQLDRTGPSPETSPMAVLLPLSDGDGPGLFCIHPGPGLGWPYSVLIRHLPAGSPLYAVQARGLTRGEALPATLHAMAADYAAEIRRRQPRGPYHLIGWSSGGPLAQAVATTLQAGGAKIGLLASLDGYPAGPAYEVATPPGLDPAGERALLRGTIERFLAAASLDAALTTPPLDDDLLTAMLKVFANTGRLLSTHRLGVFKGDLLLFKSKQAYDVPLPGAESWTPYVTGAVELMEVECHHDTMLLPGPIETIGPVIAERLRRDVSPAPKSGSAGPLSILMTNIVLAGRSGTEIMTAELARALHAKGHRVVIYTTELGPLARETMARGIPVTDRIDRIAFTPDIIHGHHNGPTAAAMIRFSDTPAIFVCHDSALSFDAPIVSDRIGAYVAIDGACVDRMTVAGVDEARIVAIPNGVDLSRFPLRERWNDEPKAALAIVKGNAPHLDRVREACGLEGLALEVVGHGAGRVVDNLPEFCAAADIVIAHSRSAMEAAVSGAAVIICDEYGFGGLLTPRELEQWPNTRLARRSLDEPVTVEALRRAIRQYRREDVARFAQMLRRRVSLDTIADEYVRLYRRVAEAYRAAPRKPDDASLASFVSEFLPRLPEYAQRAALEDAAEQRRRELDDWLAVNARGEGADTEIAFNGNALGRLLLGDGWHAPEDWCVWSGDAPAHLRLPAPLLARSGGAVKVRCAYYVPRRSAEDGVRIVHVFAAGERIAVWEFNPADYVGNRINDRALRLPEPLWRRAGGLHLVFRSATTTSPLEAGEGADHRQLGLALISIST